jgi:serine/threonine protein kinase
MFAGNYEILPRTLGSGGQGVAHLAIDVATGKQLVCKLVNLETSARNRRATHQSLRQETDVLRQLQHVRRLI